MASRRVSGSVLRLSGTVKSKTEGRGLTFEEVWPDHAMKLYSYYQITARP